jgi:hypothetical protein
LNVFRLRDEVVDGYADYVRSFLTIADPHIKGYVEARLVEGHLWPEALVQLNPAFEPGATIDELVKDGLLHLETSRVFRRLKETVPEGAPLQLRMHQEEAVRIARTGASYVLTTGTGSGKSLTYFVPIMDDAHSNRAPGRARAIGVYPMNALASSQMEELERFLTAATRAVRAGHVRALQRAGVGEKTVTDRRQPADVDPAIWDARFDPMAASTNATTVFMGTVWDRNGLLHRQMAHLADLEARDGVRRVFRVPWPEVAAEIPAYGDRVRARIAQFGE